MSEAASPTGLSKTSMVVPIANVSTLSQAWIDALGLARHQAVAPNVAAAKTTAAAKPRAAATLPARQTARVAAPETVVPSKRRMPMRATRGSVSQNRLASVEHMRVSKKIASVHPPQPDIFRRSAGRITIISRRGIVRLLLQRDAQQLRITAVCDPRLVSHITDALHASRIAYAARGITLQSSTHSPETIS